MLVGGEDVDREGVEADSNAGSDGEAFDAAESTIGGSSDTEVNEFAVIAQRRPLGVARWSPR